MPVCLAGIGTSDYHSEQAPAGDMFQCKIDEIFNDMLNVFGIADDILVIGYDKDGADRNEAVYKVLKLCQDVNLKLNKEKYHFRCTSIPFFGEVVSRQGIQPDPQKVKVTDGNTGTQKQKRNCRPFWV